MRIKRSVSRNLLSSETARFCLVGIVLFSVLSGCSGLKSKFRSSKHLDMGRFAEDMIAVAGEIQYSLGQQKATYLRDYTDTPELLLLRKEADRAKGLVRGVIAYSIQLVTLGDSRKPDVEKAAELADYLEDVVPVDFEGRDPALTFTQGQVDTILANVRSQRKFLDAIFAAQPLVDEVSIASGEIFDDLKIAMEAVVSATRHRIEDRYGDVRKADELLRRRQMQAVYNLAFLRPIRLGVPGAADSLLAHEPALAALVNTRDGIDAEEMLRIEDRMLGTLKAIRDIRDQLEPDMKMYYNQHHELDEIKNGWNAELRKARVAIVAWARAHKRMSEGVIDPAEVDVLGIARKAAGSMLP
ncbi:MAG: hypothetical protein JSW50_02075 [Candidatus Latescibacterota bacterium]|nr:MAG: hypothetical protein JSW50_02075 [Candidatus Latescibacterota bacterium]